MQPAPAAPNRSSRHRLLLVLLIIVAMLLVLGVLGTGIAARGPDFHATVYDPPETAAPIELVDHTGEPFSLQALRGSPVLLFFGYTHCPDVCPLTLTRLRAALAEAGDDAADARVLLVTVDPARDTPEVLAAYVRNFGPAVTGLTGSETQIRALLDAYHVHAGAGHDDPSVLAHTTAVFGIDREGMIRVLLRADAPREELQDDVETLLEL